MAVWTKAKLVEATDLRSVVLGGSNPFTATKFMEKHQIDAMIVAATGIAKTAHAGQKRRDGEDYFEQHVQKVANAVEPRLKPIALLHDVVEDTQVTIQDLISTGFPKYVIDAVDLLTHKNQEPNIQYWGRIAKNRDAALVKISDMKHNLSSDPNERQKSKYTLGLQFFADAGYAV